MPAEEETAPETTGKKRSSGTLKSLLTFLIVMVVFGALAFVTANWLVPLMGVSGSGEVGTSEEARTEAPKKPTGSPIYYDPIELVVNIEEKAAPMDRFLIVEISLQMESEALRQEMDSIRPQIEDLFIGILRSKTVEDLKGIQGQDRVKTELVEKANTLLTHGRIVAAYFSKFQIQ